MFVWSRFRSDSCGNFSHAWVDRGAGEAKIKRNTTLRLSKWSFWVVVSNILYFHPYLGKIPILTNIFSNGWFNHQLVFLYQTWWVFKSTVQRSSSWAMGWWDLNDVLSYTKWSLKGSRDAELWPQIHTKTYAFEKVSNFCIWNLPHFNILHFCSSTWNQSQFTFKETKQISQVTSGQEKIYSWRYSMIGVIQNSSSRKEPKRVYWQTDRYYPFWIDASYCWKLRPPTSI